MWTAINAQGKTAIFIAVSGVHSNLLFCVPVIESQSDCKRMIDDAIRYCLDSHINAY